MNDEDKKQVEDMPQTKPIVEDAEPVERQSGESGAQPNGNGPPEHLNEDLMKKLDEMSAEAETMREKYLRVMAEMDNLRRRTMREKEEARRFAALPLVEDLLPIMDHFALGLAAAQGHESGKAFADGFKMILEQLKGVLKQHGVEEISPTGEPFDPNYHESLAHQADDTVEEGKVISVQRVGYRLHDRLLRPAAVVVSSGPASASTTEEN